MLISRRTLHAVSTGLVLLLVGTAFGQDYPNRTIRIVTSPIGGSGDFVSRLVAQEISGSLGQPVIVDNRTALLARETVAKAPPDGYTLLETGNALWIEPLLQDSVPWDPVRDFLPITQVERSPNVLVVHPSLPVKTVKDLIALAKARPGELNYSAGGIGGSSHLGGELFKAMAGVNIVLVPYKGAAPAAMALIGGEVQLAFSSAGAAAAHVKSGKLRALAVTGLRPSALVPGLPTVADSGLPGFEVVSIDTILVPAKTAAAIVRRLNQEIVPILNRTDVRAKLLNIGTEVVTSSPEELAATIKSEIAKWGKLLKDAGVRTR